MIIPIFILFTLSPSFIVLLILITFLLVFLIFHLISLLIFLIFYLISLLIFFLIYLLIFFFIFLLLFFFLPYLPSLSFFYLHSKEEYIHLPLRYISCPWSPSLSFSLSPSLHSSLTPSSSHFIFSPYLSLFFTFSPSLSLFLSPSLSPSLSSSLSSSLYLTHIDRSSKKYSAIHITDYEFRPHDIQNTLKWDDLTTRRFTHEIMTTIFKVLN